MMVIRQIPVQEINLMSVDITGFLKFSNVIFHSTEHQPGLKSDIKFFLEPMP